MAEDIETRDDFEDRSKAGADGVGIVRMWLSALDAASKEEESWRKEAELVVKRYRQEEASQSTTTPTLVGSDYFNILFASVETTCPALYNSVPIPDVRRRYNDKDPVAKYTSQVTERCVSYLTDSYDFHGVMKAAVKDNELTGRGVTRVRYVPQLDQTGNQVVWEEATCEHVGWANFRHGPARRWVDVPWVGFEQFYTREQLRELCGPEIADKVRLDVEVAEDKTRQAEEPAPDIFMRARVWEIWDKMERQVVFIAPSYKDAPIRTDGDPLGLAAFFPVPKPLYAIETTDTLVPVPPYRQYRRQAEELDRVTARIMALTECLKYRGLRDSRIKDFENLATAADGDFVPVQDIEAIYSLGGGLDKAIWTMPIQELVVTLEKLTQQRESIKQVIFEITGIADIMRGQTDPRETKGAQQIKTQWGSLRIQDRQQAVAQYARDLFRLKAEVISNKFGDMTIKTMSNIELPMQQEKQAAQMMAQMQAQQQAQQQQQRPPQQANGQMPVQQRGPAGPFPMMGSA